MRRGHLQRQNLRRTGAGRDRHVHLRAPRDFVGHQHIDLIFRRIEKRRENTAERNLRASQRAGNSAVGIDLHSDSYGRPQAVPVNADEFAGRHHVVRGVRGRIRHAENGYSGGCRARLPQDEASPYFRVECRLRRSDYRQAAIRIHRQVLTRHAVRHQFGKQHARAIRRELGNHGIAQNDRVRAQHQA